jgi:modulator of FtsH protease
MSVAYAAGHWTNFGDTTATAAAALAGLLVVAVSMNLERILKYPHLPHRAGQTLTLFALPLFAALLLIVPSQPTTALGWEYLVIGLATGTCLLVSDLRTPRSGRITKATWLGSHIIPDVVPASCLAVAGATLLVRDGGGLYWLVPTMLVAIFFGLVNAWTLLIEILR